MPEARKPRRPKRPFARVAAGAAVVAIVLFSGVWVAMHRIPGVAAIATDAVRGLLGQVAVAWIEDRAYGLADRLKQGLHGHEPPVKLWEETLVPILPREGFPPRAGSAPFHEVAQRLDGAWAAVPGAPASMARTLLHTDPTRPYSAVAVVALDLNRIDIHWQVGLQEPISEALPRLRRTGLIPPSDVRWVLAAWDGGFKTMHGHYGSMLDGVTLLAPLERSCTVALYRDGTVRIARWTALSKTEPDMRAFRQTPPCLVESGQVNAEVDAARGQAWGAAVDGATIIRRSAMGIDASHRVLFVGIGESVSTRALADAMKAAGAEAAAELDVNYAYVRFLIYGDPAQRTAHQVPRATPLIPQLLFWPSEYVRLALTRDFFYATERRQAGTSVEERALGSLKDPHRVGG